MASSFKQIATPAQNEMRMPAMEFKQAQTEGNQLVAQRAPAVQMSSAMNTVNTAPMEGMMEQKLTTVVRRGGEPKMQLQGETVRNERATSFFSIKGDKNIEPEEGFQDMTFYRRAFENPKDIPHYQGNQYKDELMENARLLSTAGKGILASDESNATCGKRFDKINLENTKDNRRKYRELLFTTPNLNEHIVGAIMYDETIRQSTLDGVPFAEYLKDQGILTGIKVDTGMALMEKTNDETQTQGLDGLAARAAEYYKLGARFAKWRAVVKIDKTTGCPSDVAITETAHSLARYGMICQHNGLVPIIEPEVISDGDHDIQMCAQVTEKVLNAVMHELITQRLLLEGLLLKPNMVTEGASFGKECSPQEVAFFTVRTLSRTITPAIPGITFLSGGQSEERACNNLNAINQLAEVKHPWSMSFSFGRALQSSVLTAWEGKDENTKKAQDRLLERSKACSESALGTYQGGAGQESSDFVANYVY